MRHICAVVLVLAVGLWCSAHTDEVRAQSYPGQAPIRSLSSADSALAHAAGKRCRRKRCGHNESNIKSSSPSKGSSGSIGGGFGYLAPWPANITLEAGGRCGYFYRNGAHRNFGGRWRDDRFAVDFGLCRSKDLGIPVLSVLNGEVREAGTRPGEGRVVVVEADDGIAARYSHLGAIKVRQGQRVFEGGQLGTIGYSGTTGKRNAHLHFAIYSGRGRKRGIRPSPMAGVNLCDGCRIESLTLPPDPSSLPFKGSLEAQFPMDATGALSMTTQDTAEFGFDVRFSQPFLANRFVLRPTNPGLVQALVSEPGDIHGQVKAGTTDIGQFRASLATPGGISPGQYVLQWDVIDTQTNRLANLRPTIRLRVSGGNELVGTPCVPSSSQVLGPMSPPLIHAALDAQFPMNAQGQMFVSRGDTVGFGYNVRFAGGYNSNLVLRPNTVGTVNQFVPQFGTPGNDFPGAVSPNDPAVGYYRAVVHTPTCTPSGSYFVQWRAVNRVAPQDTDLEPSFVLVVP